MPLIALAIACSAIDGDTLRCGREHVWLIGIDAPEMPGHCRRGRVCVKGDPFKARQALAVAVRRRPLMIERLGFDRYGRTLARVTAGGVDLGCAQMRSGNAVYVRKWDRGGRAGACA